MSDEKVLIIINLKKIFGEIEGIFGWIKSKKAKNG